jgi:hypothetical protein
MKKRKGKRVKKRKMERARKRKMKRTHKCSRIFSSSNNALLPPPFKSSLAIS